MTRCILFDADGVTIIPAQLFSVLYQQQYDVSNEAMLHFFKHILKECQAGRADLKQALVPLLKEWKWNTSVDEFVQFWFNAENVPNTQLLTFIHDLRNKGICCYLATNQEKYRLQFLKEVMGFGQMFDGIISSVDLGVLKPSVEYFTKALEFINSDRIIPFSKTDILFFDDTPACIEGAKAFGINAFLYLNVEECRKIIVDSLGIIF